MWDEAWFTGTDVSFGEYKQMTERVVARWKRGEHAEALAEAERAYALETGELVEHGYGHGAWGLISVYTGLRRFDDARRIFTEVVDNKALFAARVKRDAAATEKIVVAASCIAWESGDFAAQAKTMRRAFDRRSPESVDLAYAFACFFARIGDARAWKALDAALGKGTAIGHVLADADLVGLHGDRRWDQIVARDRPWKISSTPPGARIFLDDVDTGAITPARVKPRTETHRVKLVLEGYADDESEITASNLLSMDRHLTSLAEIAERQRMIEDAARMPGAAECAKTRAFLGDVRRARIELSHGATFGLGGLTVVVHGDGRIVMDRSKFKKTDRETHCETRTDPTPLFEAFVAAGFTEMVIANMPGRPDELFFTLVLAGAGGKCQRGKFVGAPHARFDALMKAVFALAASTLDASQRAALMIAG